MGLFLVFLGAYLAIIAQGSNLNQCKHIWSFVVLLILAWLAMAEAIRSFYCKMMANYIAHEYPAILAADVVNTSPWCCRIFGFVTTARVKLKVRNHGSLTGGIHHRTAPNCYMFDDTFECKNSEKELDEGTDTSYYERIPKGQNSVAGFSVVATNWCRCGCCGSSILGLQVAHEPLTLARPGANRYVQSKIRSILI
jgi:hypothetical protein